MNKGARYKILFELKKHFSSQFRDESVPFVTYAVPPCLPNTEDRGEKSES